MGVPESLGLPSTVGYPNPLGSPAPRGTQNFRLTFTTGYPLFLGSLHHGIHGSLGLPAGTQSFVAPLGLTTPPLPPPTAGSWGADSPSTGDRGPDSAHPPFQVKEECRLLNAPPVPPRGSRPPRVLQPPSTPALPEAGTRSLAQPQPLLLLLGAPRWVSGSGADVGRPRRGGRLTPRGEIPLQREGQGQSWGGGGTAAPG